MTRVVHCKQEPYDVYIGRPSSWGNPFKVLSNGREEAINKFRDWFLAKPALVERARRELKGKILGCWCHPQKCHGDVIAEIIDKEC